LAGGAIPARVWYAALDRATDDDRWAIAAAAVNAGAREIADRAVEPLAQRNDGRALVNVGALLTWTGSVPIAALKDRPAFPSSPAPPVPLAADAQLIVVGDWGTGLPGAVAVAHRIREVLDASPWRQQHVIHLGNVYYSGTRREY